MTPITEKEKDYIVRNIRDVIRKHGVGTGILFTWALSKRIADVKGSMINHMAIEGLGGL